MSHRALVITGFGLNCERETRVAFELAGARVDCRHLNDVVADPQLGAYRVLAVIGGFSFGDHLGAGTVLASRLRQHLGEALCDFVAGGGLVIGICNGFQTLTRLGLLPALDGLRFRQQVALAHNETGVFRDAWVTLAANPASPCVFTRGIERLEVPVRHGEGRFMAEPEVLARLHRENLVALRYADPVSGEPAGDYPANPNGSLDAIAGICDPSGRVFGLMPHPEAYLYPRNHPHWQRQQLAGTLPNEGAGLAIFRNALADD